MQHLSNLAAIRFTGPDTHTFLQGQLSHDLDLLTPQRSLLASLNSAQGRVQAILHLIQRDDGVLAILPRTLLAQTQARLQKYVLRAKLRIETAESLQAVWMNERELLDQSLAIPATLGAHVEKNNNSVLRWPDAASERYVVLQTDSALPADPSADSAWQLADIRAGLPQVLPATHESFVAQMLNLDLLNGISFNKGCYTGQEIIARTHFRGSIKRRMFRFQAQTAAPSPGSRVLANGEPAGEVVMAENTSDGCELLAVVSLANIDAALTSEPTGALLQPLALPYPLAPA